jgi:hypothetical protein
LRRGQAQQNQSQQNWQNQFNQNQANTTNNQWQQNFDWDKVLQEAQLTGMFNGQPTWERSLQEAQLALQQQKAASGGSYTPGSSTAKKANQDALDMIIEDPQGGLGAA